MYRVKVFTLITNAQRMFPYACSSTNSQQIKPQIVRSQGLTMENGAKRWWEWNGNMSGAKCSQDKSMTLKLDQMLQPNCFLILLQPYSQLLSCWTFLLSHFLNFFFLYFLEELYSFFLFLIFFLSFFLSTNKTKIKQLLQTFLFVQSSSPKHQG